MTTASGAPPGPGRVDPVPAARLPPPAPATPSVTSAASLPRLADTQFGFRGHAAARIRRHSAFQRPCPRPSREWGPGPPAPGVALGSARPPARPGFGPKSCRPMMGVIRQRVGARRVEECGAAAATAWRGGDDSVARRRVGSRGEATTTGPSTASSLPRVSGTCARRLVRGWEGPPGAVEVRVATQRRSTSVERAGSTAHGTLPRAPTAARPAREARNSPTAHEPEDWHGERPARKWAEAAARRPARKWADRASRSRVAARARDWRRPAGRLLHCAAARRGIEFAVVR